MESDLNGRVPFFFILLFAAIINFIFHLIIIFILDQFTLILALRNVFFWILFAISSLASISISFKIVSQIDFGSSQEVGEKSLTLKKPQVINSQNQLKSLFSGLTVEHLGKQLKIAIILISTIYIPLDFISYLIPGVLEFSANSLEAYDPENYFLINPFFFMLLSSLIIHLSVAIREEFIYRETILIAGKKMVKEGTAFIFSIILFGLAHFNYLFNPENEGLSPFFPIWWAFNAIVVGIAAGYVVLKTNYLWPVIIAHWLNNVLSAVVIRFELNGLNFWNTSFLYLYLPIFIIGCISIIINFKKIFKWFQEIINLFKSYWKENPQKEYIVIDMLILLILWLVMMIL